MLKLNPAYLAGIVDSDGSLSINKSKVKGKKASYYII